MKLLDLQNHKYLTNRFTSIFVNGIGVSSKLILFNHLNSFKLERQNYNGKKRFSNWNNARTFY